MSLPTDPLIGIIPFCSSELITPSDAIFISREIVTFSLLIGGEIVDVLAALLIPDSVSKISSGLTIQGIF